MTDAHFNNANQITLAHICWKYIHTPAGSELIYHKRSVHTHISEFNLLPRSHSTGLDDSEMSALRPLLKMIWSHISRQLCMSLHNVLRMRDWLTWPGLHISKRKLKKKKTGKLLVVIMFTYIHHQNIYRYIYMSSLLQYSS